jgi:UDP-N-acetylglucosamine 1-carboxyvinyltransferase
MAASIVSGRESVIHNCPDLSDVSAAVKILEHLGCRVKREEGDVCIDSAPMDRTDIPDELMREMRSSVIFLGAILARAGEATLSYPGGCELGPRPIDLHLSSLRAMGVDITETSGNIICTAGRMRGTKINLATPSVGATENILLAACRAEGDTIIMNAAREPEISDLAAYLQKIGAVITGAGTPVIICSPIINTRSAEHSVLSDRIAAAT